MTLKRHRFPPNSRFVRGVILELKAACAVVPDLLSPSVLAALVGRGWLSPGEPCRLTAKGWRGVAGSDAAVHARRSAAAVVAHGADPYQVARNARRKRQRYRDRHEAPTFGVWLEEALERVAGPGSVEHERDRMPIEGSEFGTLRVLGEHGLLAMYDDACVLVGPCDHMGAVQPITRKNARKAWKLVGRGLARAVHVQASGGTITVRIERTESGAQVLAAATTVS